MKKYQYYCIKRIDDVLGAVTFVQRFPTISEARKTANREHLQSEKVSKVIILKVTHYQEVVEEIDNPKYRGLNND